MKEDKLKKLEREINEEKFKRNKLVWKHANSWWRMIIIIGYLTFFGLAFWFGGWIASVLGLY